METNKCDDMDWFAADNLPAKTLPYTREAILNFKSGQVDMSHQEPGSII